MIGLLIPSISFGSCFQEQEGEAVRRGVHIAIAWLGFVVRVIFVDEGR